MLEGELNTSPVVTTIVQHYREHLPEADHVVKGTSEIFAEVFDSGDSQVFSDFYDTHTTDSIANDLGRVVSQGRDYRIGKIKATDNTNKWRIDLQKGSIAV